MNRLREALAWPSNDSITLREIAIALLGMAVPVALGLAADRAGLGFSIGLGAMLLAGQPGGAGQSGDAASPESALAPALLAVAVAAALAWLPFNAVAMVGLTGLAALACNYSRPIAVAAIRFIIYFVLTMTLIDGAGGHRREVALAFGLGAVWNIVIRMFLAPRPGPVVASIDRVPSAEQRRAHLRRVLATLPGWQYALRITGGLTIACGIRALFPAHHFDWVVLTVALLTQHAIEHLPVKAIQRTAGTLLGVSLTWMLLVTVSGTAALAIAICLLATGAGIARRRNYLAYSVLATPVILLVIDLRKTVDAQLLIDRLLATLIGAAIVILANLLVDRWIRARQHTLAQAAAP